MKDGERALGNAPADKAIHPNRGSFPQRLAPPAVLLDLFPLPTHTFVGHRKGTGSWKLPMGSGSPRSERGRAEVLWLILAGWCSLLVWAFYVLAQRRQAMLIQSLESK